MYLVADNSGSLGKVDGKSMTERVLAKINGQTDAASAGDLPVLADFLVRVRPGLFAGIPKDVLVKALQNKEKGLVGIGPTENIRRMKKALTIRSFLSRPRCQHRVSLLPGRSRTRRKKFPNGSSISCSSCLRMFLAKRPMA